MDIQEGWEKALKLTEIIRPRVQPLHTYEVTRLPYWFLSESSINPGDTVVRKGEVLVEKPAIVMPFNMPHFEGFDFDGVGMGFKPAPTINEDSLITFFLLRGVSFPSLKYNNKTASIDVYEGGLSRALDHYASLLHRSEDVHTGLITGPEDTWQFSVLIFVGTQVIRSAEGDIKKLFEEYRRRGRMS